LSNLLNTETDKINSVVIDSTVAHVADNRNDKLVLADLPVRLDDEVLAFLRIHVVKSIKHSGIAIFNDRYTNNVSLSCEEIFAHPSEIDSTCKEQSAPPLSTQRYWPSGSFFS
jgi:hypothetical protein